MKRYHLIILLLLLIPPAVLTAETVLLYTSDDWLTPEITRGADYIVPALEDGFMEAFFDAGHIIFNDQAPPLAVSPESGRMRNALLLAKRGGARFMVELEIIYDRNEDVPVPLPLEVVFSVTDVVSNRFLLEDRLFPQDFHRPEFTEQREVCQLLGATLAGRVLELM